MNYRSFVAMAALFLLGMNLSAQVDSTEASVMDQALVPAKIIAARHQFTENNMRGALTLFREVLDADPTNASAMYGIAECHYNLKKYRK